MTGALKPRPTREETRSRILDTASDLFRQYGFGKTTIADIADELEMSSANIYKFFASKDELVQASADRNLAQIRRDVTAIVHAGGGVAARLEDSVLVIFRFHQELFRNERQIYKMVIQAVEEAWECIDQYYAFLTETITGLLEEGMAAGEMRKGDAGALAVAVLDALFLALHPHMRHSWQPDEDETRVRAHINLVVTALR